MEATITEREASSPVSSAASWRSRASANTLKLPRPAQIAGRQRYFRRMTGLLEDVALLMLGVLLLPLTILLVGAPIALCVRAVIEIVHLLS
jgi:hypothetical protein